MANRKTKLGARKTEQGARIRRQRDQLGLSRSQLQKRIEAEGIEISQSQIGRWENGSASPGSEAAGGLERALGVHPGWLAHGEQAPAKQVTAQAPVKPAPAKQAATVLSYSGLISLLVEVSEDERYALSEHLRDRESANERIDESYVRGYLRGLRDTRISAPDASAADGMMIERRREVAAAPRPTTKRKEVK